MVSLLCEYVCVSLKNWNQRMLCCSAYICEASLLYEYGYGLRVSCGKRMLCCIVCISTSFPACPHTCVSHVCSGALDWWTFSHTSRTCNLQQLSPTINLFHVMYSFARSTWEDDCRLFFNRLRCGIARLVQAWVVGECCLLADNRQLNYQEILHCTLSFI